MKNKGYVLFFAVALIVLFGYNARHMNAADAGSQGWVDWGLQGLGRGVDWLTTFERTPYSNRDIAVAAGAQVLDTALSHIPRGVVPLNLYWPDDQSRPALLRREQNIKRAITRAFLSQQILKAGLDQDDFGYYVGDQWAVFRLSGGTKTYGLVVPGAASSLALNVDDLGVNLKKKGAEFRGSPEYNAYRLEVVKALVAAKLNGVLKEPLADLQSVKQRFEVAKNLSSAALSAISLVLTRVSDEAYYAAAAIGALYDTIWGASKVGLLEEQIDAYVIHSLDLGLLEARVAELRTQSRSGSVYYLNKVQEIGAAMLESAGGVPQAIKDYILPSGRTVELALLQYNSESLAIMERYLEQNRGALAAVDRIEEN